MMLANWNALLTAMIKETQRHYHLLWNGGEMVVKVVFFHLELYLDLYLVVSSSRLPEDAEKEARGSIVNMNLPHIIQACV